MNKYHTHQDIEDARQLLERIKRSNPPADLMRAVARVEGDIARAERELVSKGRRPAFA